MGALERINIGIVGACGRGKSFKLACDAMEVVDIHAVCDINEEGLAEAKETLGAAESYVDFEEMLEKSELDAVIIGTPMHMHVPQALAAVKEGLHAITEVPVGVNIDECRELVQEVNKQDVIFMMAENYTYIRSNKIVQEIVDRGLFGTVYYAEGEYIHELKGLNEITKWRRKWQTGVNGVTYCTHSLGPVLQWFGDDRVVEVSCRGSGHHYVDPRGDEYESEESCIMLCKMREGGLVKIRVDMLSDRPHAMTNYQLQGTDGCYESARGGPGDINKIWLRDRCPDVGTWMNLDELAEEFVPEMWRVHEETAKNAGHGGGDYFEILDFVEAIQGTRKCPIGLHESMDMTLPGLVSQLSIEKGGEWMKVPDSREW